ncbi:hypothetical protein [Methylicorpusculum sp.]|uniref:hypothetical protein n=1 Tax=Methylicorpusculum sp. TaxID=2713644 RepID=UPI002ABC9505|nr:hypothetical protein [Methylicorpusculum sp.]MDZ4152201.1 hypothetical protein [Methylicorpusculum sp.]
MSEGQKYRKFKGYVRVNSRRRPGRDCRGPEAMDGVGLSHPCDLDSGNPCRNDGVGLLSTTNANIAKFKGIFEPILDKTPRQAGLLVSAFDCFLGF